MSSETRKKQGGSKPKWMYARDGVQHGPFTSKDLQALANRGELLPTDLIWKEGMKDWVRADKSSVVFPEPTENPVANDFNKKSDFQVATAITLDAIATPQPTRQQAPTTGLRGLIDAAREGWNEATLAEEQKHCQEEEVLVEDLSWFQKTLAELITSEEAVHFQLEGLDVSGLVCTDKRVVICHTGHFTWMLGNVKTFQASYDEIMGVSLIEERLRIQPLLGGGYVFEVVTPEAKAGATAAGSFFEFAAEPNRIAFGKEKLPKLKKAEAFIRERMQAMPPKTSITQSPTVDLVLPVSPKQEPGRPSVAVADGSDGRSMLTNDDVVTKLKSLAELKSQGLLTDDEFVALKQKLLEHL